MLEARFLSVDDVLAIHGDTLRHEGGHSGLRDVGLLESAVLMPQQTFDGELLHPGLLVDDLAARRAAESSFRAARVPTKLKGTLGVIVSAVRAGYLSAGEGIDLVAAIGSRPDIWVHERLCSQVIETLRRGAV